MKPADILIALMVAIIWGLAFVASRIALDEFSPELMTAMRFSIAAVPCLFIPKPKIAWSLLIAISFTLFLGQFLSQAYGIAHGVPGDGSTELVVDVGIVQLDAGPAPSTRDERRSQPKKPSHQDDRPWPVIDVLQRGVPTDRSPN